MGKTGPFSSRITKSELRSLLKRADFVTVNNGLYRVVRNEYRPKQDVLLPCLELKSLAGTNSYVFTKLDLELGMIKEGSLLDLDGLELQFFSLESLKIR